MLYRDLEQLSMLDQQINQLQSQLIEFYKQRAALVTPTATAKPATTPAAAVRAIYNQQKTAWRAHGIKVPAFASLQPKLKAALQAEAALIAAKPHLENKFAVIIVPPYRSLMTAYSANSKHQLAFTEAFDRNGCNKSTAWSCLLVAGSEFALPITTISEDLGATAFTYNDYDCRGLTVRGVLASELLGHEVVTGNNWALLLSESADAQHIACVSKQDNSLIFDIDDGRCLLGNNYLQPAVYFK